MIKKRLKALALAGVFLLCSVVPVRQANAVLPIAIGMTMQAFGAGGSLVSANLLTAGVSALIGGTIFALGLTPSDMGDGTNPVGLRIPTIDDPVKTEAAMPAPNASPTVATSTQNCAQWLSHEGVLFSETCVTGAVDVIASCPGTFIAYNSRCDVGGVIYEFSSRSTTGCPPGYNLAPSGTSCNLVSARASVSDSKVDVIRTPTGYTMPTTAQDADAVPSYATASGGVVRVAGRDSSGRPVMIEYAVSPDGTKTYIRHYTQTESGGQTVVQTKTVTIDANSGAVIGGVGGVNAGSIDGLGTGNTTIVNNGAAVAPADIVFPSDYARTGEAASAANVVKGAVDALAEPLKNTETLNDPTVPDYVDPWGTTFSMLKGWSLPGHSSSCPVGSFEWNGGLYVIDAHCQLVADHFGVIQAAMSVVWVVLALFVVLGA